MIIPEMSRNPQFACEDPSYTHQTLTKEMNNYYSTMDFNLLTSFPIYIADSVFGLKCGQGDSPSTE